MFSETFFAVIDCLTSKADSGPSPNRILPRRSASRPRSSSRRRRSTSSGCCSSSCCRKQRKRMWRFRMNIPRIKIDVVVAVFDVRNTRCNQSLIYVYVLIKKGFKTLVRMLTWWLVPLPGWLPELRRPWLLLLTLPPPNAIELERASLKAEQKWS